MARKLTCQRIINRFNGEEVHHRSMRMSHTNDSLLDKWYSDSSTWNFGPHRSSRNPSRQIFLGGPFSGLTSLGSIFSWDNSLQASYNRKLSHRKYGVIYIIIPLAKAKKGNSTISCKYRGSKSYACVQGTDINYCKAMAMATFSYYLRRLLQG